MQLDQFTQLWFNNLYTIISVLFIAVLVFIFFLSILSFKEGKSEETGEKLTDLEETLKRVLENTEVRASAVSGVSVSAGATSTGAATAEGGGVADGEMDKLQTELAEKEVEIMRLNDQIADLGAGGGSGNSEELESKVKDLEAKLQEYEIIEDDIANLSLYKQENAKLKEEIDQLKAGGASAAASETAAEPAPAVEEAATDTAAEEDDDIMAEFAAAVQDQKSVESGEVAKE